MDKRQLILSVAAITLFGCASSKVSTLPVASESSHAVKTIAMSPKGGPMTDEIAVELSNKGFEVIDTISMIKSLVQLITCPN